MTFDQWKSEVDDIFQMTMGCTSDDVEDYLWNEDYRSGMTPAEAFKEWDIAQNYTTGLF